MLETKTQKLKEFDMHRFETDSIDCEMKSSEEVGNIMPEEKTPWSFWADDDLDMDKVDEEYHNLYSLFCKNVLSEETKPVTVIYNKEADINLKKSPKTMTKKSKSLKHSTAGVTGRARHDVKIEPISAIACIKIKLLDHFGKSHRIKETIESSDYRFIRTEEVHAAIHDNAQRERGEGVQDMVTSWLDRSFFPCIKDTFCPSYSY